MVSAEDFLGTPTAEGFLGIEAPQAPVPSQARTALQHGLKGATFGFSDEAAAAIGAGGAKAIDYARGMMGGEEEFADKSFGELYDTALEQERGSIEAGAEAHPGTAITSEIAGAIGTGVAGASTKLGGKLVQSLGKGTLAQKSIRSAALAGTTGGLYGAGEAEEDRLEGAIDTAIMSAGLGLALPVAGAGVKEMWKGGKELAKAAQEGSDWFRGVVRDTVGDPTAQGKISESVEVVKKIHDAVKREVSTAFTIAKKEGRDAILAEKKLIPIVKRATTMRLHYDKGIHPDDLEPGAQRLFNQLDGYLEEGSISLNRLEGWRKRVTNYANTKRGTNEGVALSVLRDSYDEVIGKNVEKAVKSGNKESVRLWRDAIGKRRTQGNLFGTNKYTGQTKIFENIVTKDSLVPEELVNALNLNKANTGQIVTRMLDVAKRAGEEDVLKKNLRDGYILDIFEKARNVDDVIDIKKVKGGINRLLNKNKTVSEAVLSKSDRDALINLKSQLNKGIIDKAILTPIEKLFGFGPLKYTPTELVGWGIREGRKVSEMNKINKFMTDIFDEARPEKGWNAMFYGDMIIPPAQNGGRNGS